jgi:phospholipid/cholesterol/gamma-HCH transport system ATP-binding protein
MKKSAGMERTLVLKQKIILYDEPTTGLDPFTSQGISELVVKVKKRYNTTSILVTHDMKCAKVTADRMIIMDQGKIIARGKYEELQNKDDEIIKGFFK